MVEKINEQPSFRREFPFLFTITLFCLAYVTFIFEIVPSVTPIFKILPLIPLVLVFPKWKPNGLKLRFILIYSMLIIYGYLLVIRAEDFLYSMSYASKYFLRLIFFFLLLLALKPDKMTDRLVRVFAWVGVAFSLQGFALWILYYIGLPPATIHSSNEGLDVIWSPLWGNVGGALSGNILRVASYFKEASLFGCFLEYSFWISLGYAVRFRIKKYYFATAVSALGVLSTFSMASFMSLGVSGIVLLIYTVFDKDRWISSLVKIGVSACAVFIFVTKQIDDASEDYVQAFRQGRIAGDKTGGGELGVFMLAFGRYADPRIEKGGAGRVGLMQRTVNIFLQEPFGIGIIDPKASRLVSLNNVSATAPIMWLVWVGAPGLCILILAVGYGIFLGVRQLRDPKDLRGYLGLAFLSQSVHHLVYGTWMDPFYLFILACIVVTQSQYFLYVDEAAVKKVA